MSEKQIEFIYDGDVEEPDPDIHPVPASDEIPTWFRMTPTLFDRGSNAGTTVKLCKAFSDALNLGFMIPAPEDIHIERFSDFSIQSQNENVHVYGPTPFTNDRNSKYPMPEVKIENPWKIKTPPGYSCLITKPLNRMFEGFEPNSLFVPTDTYDGPINIPAVMSSQPHDIEKGEPLVQVIPFKREEVLNYRNLKRSDHPELSERAATIRRQLDTRKDLYRAVYHQEKPLSEVRISDSESPGLVDSNDESALVESDIADRSDSHGEYVTFLTDDQDYGITPGPYHAEELAPPWIGDLADTLEAPDSDSGSVTDEELFDEWIAAACSLGTIDVVPTDVHMKNEEKYVDRDMSTMFDKALGSHALDEKIGPKFPHDLKICGIATNRYITTPDGYSSLMMDPLNHYAQDIRGFNGVVDHDVWIDVTNMPSMIFNQNPEFVFEKGSATMQPITFKRESLITNGVVHV